MTLAQQKLKLRDNRQTLCGVLTTLVYYNWIVFIHFPLAFYHLGKPRWQPVVVRIHICVDSVCQTVSDSQMPIDSRPALVSYGNHTLESCRLKCEMFVHGIDV